IMPCLNELESLPQEEFGIAQADTPVREEDRDFEYATNSVAANDHQESTSSTSDAQPDTPAESDGSLEQNWDGDGSSDTSPDDGEWGGDAPPRKSGTDADGDFKKHLNPHSLEVITAKCEPSLKDASPDERYQFERMAYFTLDKDSSLTPNAPRLIFNRTITLKDAWAKEAHKV
ncbi:MAG: hypothetical protein RL616_2052, partial [Verrucomicrobiota bacterium]